MKSSSPTFSSTDRSGLKKKIVIASFLAVAIGIAAYVFNGFNRSEIDAISFIWPDEDPFDGEVYPWANGYVSNKVLSIRVINSLDERYHPYFDSAIQDWDNGSPDVLNLRIETSAPDPECRSTTGAMRVCNSDHGQNDWEGINKVLLRNGKITSSVAILNDFYMNRSSTENIYYTTCHELGHGFGLPHTDERFWNFDQGNCMDYTNWPENNQQPGQVSFDRLALLYGWDVETDTNTDVDPSIAALNEAVDINVSTEENTEETVPNKYLQLFDKIMGSVDENGEQKEFEEIDLGDGYSSVVYKKLVF
uniref:Peptidase M10 metallopeptidase domain-containing protein n=1 Tax=Pseudictyota dubia TaxID=2749911 RepID=A0A6U2AYY6_9STRA